MMLYQWWNSKISWPVKLWRLLSLASAVSLLCALCQIPYRDWLLRQAVGEMEIGSVEYLLKQGANPNVAFLCKGEDDCTAMQGAVTSGSCELIHLLLKYGGDPNAHNELDSALTVAAAKGDIGTVQELIQAGSDPTWQRRTGETAYRVAWDGNHDAVIRYLSALPLRRNERRD